MKLRPVLASLAVAAVGVIGVQSTVSSAAPTRQNFTLTSDISEEGGGTVVASGAINATGEDVVISDTEDLFVFPDGTLTVFHAPERTSEHFNERRCTVTFRETGTYVIAGDSDRVEQGDRPRARSRGADRLQAVLRGHRGQAVVRRHLGSGPAAEEMAEDGVQEVLIEEPVGDAVQPEAHGGAATRVGV